MKDLIDLIINNGAGVVALASVFYFAWYVIQNIIPILLEVKASNEMNIEVIKNNTEVIKGFVDSLKNIEMQNEAQKKDHLQMIKNYEIHNERTIRVEQTVGILLDRIDK